MNFKSSGLILLYITKCIIIIIHIVLYIIEIIEPKNSTRSRK